MSQDIYSYKKDSEAIKEHVLIALLMNRPGALSRVMSLFRRRRFNIKSITAGASEVCGIHRLTFVVDGENANVEQVIKQLEKLIEVIEVHDITHDKRVTRELALIKIGVPNGMKNDVREVIEKFKGCIINIEKGYLLVEIVGEPGMIDNFIEECKRYGILEVVRTGVSSMVK